MRWRRCYNGYQLVNADEEVVGTLFKDRGTWHACRTDAFGFILSTRYHDYFKDAKADLVAHIVAVALEDS